MNKVILIGRLGQDPELRYTPNGTAVCNFSIAVERSFTNQQGKREVDWVNIVVWRKQAENCANYLEKGRQVAVEGRLQIRSYETDEGQKRKVTEVVANNVQFLDYGQGNGGGNNQGQKANNNQSQGGKEDIDVPF